MIKRLIHQEDLTILNIHVMNNSFKILKAKMGRTVIVRSFSTSFSNWASGKKISKDIDGLNNTVGQLILTDV